MSPTLPANTLPASPALASPSTEASVKTRRSAGSDLSTPATASSWSPSVALSSSVPEVPSLRRQLGAGLGGGASEHQPAPFCEPSASCLGGLEGVEVGQEAVDHAAAALVVVEALAHDPPGEGGGQRADLRAQRGDGLLPLGGDLRVAVVDDAGRLGLRLLPHLGDDLGALLASLLADARRLVAGVGDLRLELRLGGVGVGLRACSRSANCLRIASWRLVIALLIGGMTYFASRKNSSANAASSTRNVPLGTRKLLSVSAIGTSVNHNACHLAGSLSGPLRDVLVRTRGRFRRGRRRTSP